MLDKWKYFETKIKMKGGGSSSGGSSSGRVSYPAYMEAWHSTWLDNVATAMTAAQTTSPFNSVTAYDPATPLAATETAVAAFNAAVDALANETDWESAMTAAETQVDSMIDDTYIDADIAAFADVLDDQIVNTVLPAFEGGMRDINAVMSSAFAIGKSVIYGFRNRDVSKYGTELRVKLNIQRNALIAAGADRMLGDLIQRVSFEKDVAFMTAETNRIKIVALKEQDDEDLAIDENDALWDLNTFQFGSNVLAGIAGGTAASSEGGNKPSQVASVLGGAMAGAAVGTAINPGYGTAIGAVVGGVAGLLSSS